MKKLLLIIALAIPALANQGVQGFCEQGNTAVQTAGLPSTNVVQGSFPACTVSVFTAGTTNLVTIFADNINTPLSNPFTANASGHWLFYSANNQRLDIQLSGGGLPAPWKINDVILNDPNGGIIAPSNLANIRIVDGVRFAQTAAGINAADADLGNVPGEIWIPSPVVTATDAQISIGSRHTLKVFGNLTIEAATKGPILLGNAAGLTCASPNSAIQEATTSASMSSMVRATTQDGSQAGNFIERCQFFANSGTFSNGVIDASGFLQGHIRDVLVNFYNSGFGIFIQDVQSGALAGTNNLEILNVQTFATATAGCIELGHSGTNSVLIYAIHIQDIECTSGTTIVSAPILLTNGSAGQNIREVGITNALINTIPGGQPGITINGVFQSAVRHVACYSPGSGSAGCVNITNNAQNGNNSVDNITTFPGSNSITVVDASKPGGLPVNSVLNHYDAGVNFFTGTVSTSNFNNIRIVDGVRFAFSAAGINAADADLGSNNGEVWLPTNTNATDAQISIRAGHTLRIFQNLGIDASATHGPILLGDGARISCVSPSGAANGQIVQNITSVTLSSMVRLTAQDGSQAAGVQLDGCAWFANNNAVTNGVLDISGAVNKSIIKDNRISGFTSGFGIFAQDIQSGLANGTNSVQITANQIQAATGTGGCIEVIHSATNSVTIAGIDISDINCAVGSTSGASILFQNTDATASHLRQIFISNILINGTPSGQASVQIVGVQQATVKGIACLSGSNCVNIVTSSNNSTIIVDNVLNYNGTNALNDVANAVSVLTSLNHYEFTGANPGYNLLAGVSYLRVQGLTPASATGSGFGTGPAFSLASGSTNNAGTIIITVGTTPSTSGTVTVNFNTAQSNFGVNPPVCVWQLQNSTNSWSANAVIGPIIGASTTSDGVTWNNTVALTAAGVYAVNYWCAAK